MPAPLPVPVIGDDGACIGDGGKGMGPAVFKAATSICKALEQITKELGKMDAVVGDGDCGDTVARGAAAVLSCASKSLHADGPTALLQASRNLFCLVKKVTPALCCLY